MAWSIQASGHAITPEDERNLFANLNNVLVNAAYGVASSQFAGEAVAGTPGIPEPEPEPALPTLSPEAQITALQEELANARAQLAAQQEGGL